MLPFLIKKQPSIGGTTTTYRPSDAEDKGKDNDPHGLEACAEDLMKAFHSNDKRGVAEAIKAMFEICDAMPHEEFSESEDEQE